jgi:hypothetical protein
MVAWSVSWDPPVAQIKAAGSLGGSVGMGMVSVSVGRRHFCLLSLVSIDSGLALSVGVALLIGIVGSVQDVALLERGEGGESKTGETQHAKSSYLTK